jgi:hypothetical protein
MYAFQLDVDRINILFDVLTISFFSSLSVLGFSENGRKSMGERT